jgi:hypothetical protein
MVDIPNNAFRTASAPPVICLEQKYIQRNN